MSKEISSTVEVGGKQLHIKTGKLAARANAAVTVQYGETVVFCSVVMGNPNPNLNYFPLQVEYLEKLFAGGKIKGSRWVKRDGKPSDDAILKARLIDRSIRPLFPKGFRNEVQVVVNIYSADGENDADMAAMYAVSYALSISDIPWAGPISAVRIGRTLEGEFMINPTFSQRETSQLDLVVSGTADATLMVEAGAKEIDEATMLEAFAQAQAENARIATEIATFASKHGKTKAEYTPTKVPAEVINVVKTALGDQLNQIVTDIATLKPWSKTETIQAIAQDNPEIDPAQISDAIEELIKKTARHNTIATGTRPDGRSYDQIRPLSSEVGLLPRTHGSALFTRGNTQALTITTLGSPSLNQLIENMEGEFSKRYIHHYVMPPYTVGETGRIGWPSRREIGHGALAERALEPMIPSEEEFPYTIQVVSELMSSNGSTSMASVCGSTLSLMDAGVPIKKPVAGIAMGLLKEGDTTIVLSDIMGFEDHTGDMDFKVAGTKDGITAMQMDIKISGISHEILTQALEQARVGRLYILDHMLQTLSESRQTVSRYAPKIVTTSVPPDRIGEVIGAGGKVIRNIIETTGAEVDINDDGTVFVSGIDQDAIDQAIRIVEGIVKEVEPGEEYQGTVVKIMDFGAFVEFLPGKSGMVHVSNLSSDYVKDPRAVVSVGDQVTVWVKEVDKMGRINLTMRNPKDPQPAREPRRDGFSSRPKGRR